MRNKEKKNAVVGAGQACSGSPTASGRHTQKRTGTHTPTERHANTHSSPSSHFVPLFPVLSPTLSQLGQVRQKHKNLAFLPVPRASRLRPTTAQLLIQFIFVALGDPLPGPQFPHMSQEETPQTHFTRMVERIRRSLCRSQWSSLPSAGSCLWPVPSQPKPR